MSKIGITMGDPAGIGPELVVKLLSGRPDTSTAYVIYGDREVMERAIKLVGKSLPWCGIGSVEEVSSPGIYLLQSGEPTKTEPSLSSGRAAVSYLARAAVDACRGELAGILTMPINKFWARKAGFSLSGQTEYLARVSATDDFAMMLYSDKIRVVLITTHIPLAEVPRRIKKDLVVKKALLVWREMERLFGLRPRIGVLGLNPHAGEGGEIGDEELREISPAIEELRDTGVDVEGPLPPDTAFLKDYDVFLCPYHDEGLIPFKLLSFREGVNLTLGLPFPRTSPDHGTAYDIAWKGVADPTSAEKALALLEKLIHNLYK